MKNKIIFKIPQFFGGGVHTLSECDKGVGNIKKEFNAEEYERCILCGSLTNIPISMPIDFRENYEIGCGQICDKCAKMQQKMQEGEPTLTMAQVLQAFEESVKENIK